MRVDVVICLKCGAEVPGYILDDGRVYGLQSDGTFANTWVWGCAHCNP